MIGGFYGFELFYYFLIIIYKCGTKFGSQVTYILFAMLEFDYNHEYKFKFVSIDLGIANKKAWHPPRRNVSWWSVITMNYQCTISVQPLVTCS